MARKVEWTHRIPSALSILRELPGPTLDRAGIGKLFEVSPRQAIRIMERLGAHLAGKSLILGRQELIAKLESLELDESVQFERRRRGRFLDDLERTRKDLAARRVAIPVSPDVRWRQIAALSPAIQFAPHKLEIAFTDTPDLLKHLFELSQAIANDYEGFNDRLQRGWSG